MPEQTPSTNSSGFRCDNLLFVKIFGGFRSAIQPAKIMLALCALVAICLIGWITDGMAPNANRVIVQATGVSSVGRVTEIDAYANGDCESRKNFDSVRQALRQNNNSALLAVMTHEPFNMERDKANQMLEEGDALSDIRHRYNSLFDDAVNTLGKRYQLCSEDIENYYDKRIKRGDDKAEQQTQRSQKIEKLQEAYLGIFNNLINPGNEPPQKTVWVNTMVVIDEEATGEGRAAEAKLVDRDKKELLDAMTVAQAYQLAQTAQGQGIFTAFLDFKLRHMHNAATALVTANIPQAGKEVATVIRGTCWLIRYHAIHTTILVLMCLAIWAIFGGAICRISAVAFARQERIGPVRALKFSLSKFAGFFSAPLVPIAILIAIGLAILLPSLLVAVPIVGEIIGGILMPLALLGGFIIAVISVGLIGGYNLMFPAIAVEGSDSFDAISRSYSYVFGRPWRMGLYSLIAAVYGSICYMFVRLFVFLLLMAVHISAGAAINIDSSSLICVRGKLEAIWPTPQFDNLQPAINWAGLNWSETVGAGLMWIWVALVSATVLAFAISFFYSVNTIIYFLLRNKVDATDMEDIYMAQDTEELIESSDFQEGIEPDTAQNSDSNQQDPTPPTDTAGDNAPQQEPPQNT